MIEEYKILISVSNNCPEIDISGNTPCVLADKIKAVVKDFYKEEHQ